MPSILDAGVAHGYFLCLLAPHPAQTRLFETGKRARRELALRGPLRPRELLHVTLAYLGAFDGPDERVDRLLQAVRQACDGVSHPSFEIGFDTLMAFGAGRRKKPIVAVGAAGTDGVLAFQAALSGALRAYGVDAGSGGFNPHVTLLYSEDEMRVPWKFDPVRWIVREFQLVHSNIGRSRYDIIDRWPLRSCALDRESFPRRLAASNGARTLMSLSK